MKINGNIIAHRGVFNNIDVPENSISAFKKAVQLNIPIELDVQLTKDNILVVFHDDDLRRMTDKCIILQDANYDLIKDINLLNTKEKIPTFKQVLNIVEDKVLIDIEIKDTKRIKETCDILLKELSNYKNFIVKSFNPRIIRYIKKKNPRIEVGLLIHNKYDSRILDFISKSVFTLYYSKADFISISKKLLNTKKYKKLSLRYPTLIWTIKEKEEIKNNKIIYICNNLPFDK